MDTFGTTAWVKFFTDSGIPQGVACNYAVTFTDNRITKNMLLDLNKEILQDMGISVMGDVIAILKHSKVVHDQITRAKVFESEASVAPVLPERRNTPVTRLVDHYTKQKLPSSPWVQPQSTLSVQPLEPAPPAGRPAAVKRSLEQLEIAPPKKPRRVLPEHEGSYKISMPAGSTAKTKRLLQQQKALAAQSPIFKRLGVQVGASVGPANTFKVPAPVVATKKVTLAAPVVTRATKSSSVFARLGPADTVSSGEDDEVSANAGGAKRVAPLPYQGILKTAVGPRKTSVLKAVGRPSTVPSNDVVGVKTVIRKTVANTRAGSGLPEVRRTTVTNSKTVQPTVRLGVGSQGILASRKATFNLGVQSRLGAKARLGPAPGESRMIAAPKRLTVALPQQTNFGNTQGVRIATRKVGGPPTVAATRTAIRKPVPVNSGRLTSRPGCDGTPPQKIGVFSRLGPMVDI